MDFGASLRFLYKLACEKFSFGSARQGDPNNDSSSSGETIVAMDRIEEAIVLALGRGGGAGINGFLVAILLGMVVLMAIVDGRGNNGSLRRCSAK